MSAALKTAEINACAIQEQKCEQIARKIIIEQARLQYLHYAEENARSEVMQQQRTIASLEEELRKSKVKQAEMLSALCLAP